MNGCPSREQLANLVARRTIEIEGFDLGEHARLCARCRAVVKSLSDAGTIDSALERNMSSAAPAGSSLYETIDTAVRPPAGDSFSATIDTAVRAAVDSSSVETIDAASGRGQPPARTAFSTGSGGPGEASAAPETQEATLEASYATGEATLDLTQENPPRRRQPSPAAASVPSMGGKRGPADYEILGELGRGGMGIVYKALHRRLNRVVALKMIRGGVHADDIQVTRFRIEAEAVAALRHPNILQIYEIGESDGLPYVALELLEGGSLADKLHGTPLPPRKAAELMVPMALAMDAAHKAGIIHRDLKSVNILFTADGVPKITDFGLAKRLEVDEGHTHTGQVMGTPSYMAPEQARGDTKNVGTPADIYALGAILYEMLTGRPPFKGVSAMDTVKQVIEVEPVAPSRVQYRVPRDLETICLKCLQKEARKRYPTAKDMADDLNRYLVGEPIRARRTPPVERGVKWVRRHPTRATLIGFAVLGFLGFCGAGAWSWNRARVRERMALAHAAELREQTADDLMNAQALLTRSDPDSARVVLVSRKTILDREKIAGLASLHEKTTKLLGEVEAALDRDRARQSAERARIEVQNRYRQFLDARKEALFRDTQFTGLMVPTGRDLTRKSAEKALGVFGTAGDDGVWALGELPLSLSSEQQVDVKEGFYELLLVLAETTAALGPEKADRALQALDSAARLRPGQSRAYHLMRAKCLALKGDKGAADRELAEAARLRPDTPFDHFLAGQQEFKEKKYAEAIQNFESALRQKPDHFWAKCLQAICYIQTARYEAAKASLNDCLTTDPNFAWLYLLRGFASGQLGARYQHLVAGSPGRESTLHESADFEFGQAEADLQEALERLKNLPDDDLQYVLLINRGLVRFQRGRLDQAAADYNEAIKLNKHRFDAHAELAHVYEKQGKLDLAIDQFTQAIALKPNWSPLYRGRARLLQASAGGDPRRRAAALADLDDSIKYETQTADKVLALDHTNRGMLLYADERFGDALAESKLALAVDPRFADAHVLQVRSLLKLRRFDEVILACDAAIATGKKSAVLFELRGLAHAARHDYPAAIRDYGEALELRPDDARLLAERGWAYLVFDSARLGLADFEAAIRLNPADGDAYSGRGTARALRGDHAGAVADAREALTRGGQNPLVVYRAARIYAIAAAAMAKELGENGRQARQLSARYEDMAVQLIRQAFEREAPEKRAGFWRDTVQSDPALKTIRRRIRFEDLIVTNK